IYFMKAGSGFLTDIDQFVQQKREHFIEVFQQLVAIPSICGDEAQIKNAVAFLSNLLKKLFDCQIEILSTAGSPVIFCHFAAASSSEESILFYGHYDVMAAEDVEKWQTDPFQLTLKEGRLFGRGAGDNKGQLLDVIFGLYAFKSLHQQFPCQINLIIEGEEEKGSVHLNQVVKQLSSQQLRQIKTVFVIDGSFSFAGQHVLRLGNRGLLGFEVNFKTNETDLHSGNFGNVSPNPILVFHQILEQLYDFKKQRVLIPHFYDGTKQVSQTEAALLEKLPPVRLSSGQSSEFFKEPENKFEYYKRLMFEPSFNINGIQSGFLGQGIKTIIPSQLKVRFDFRLVSGQNVSQIQRELNCLLAPWISNKLLSINYLAVIPPYYAGVENKLMKQVIQGIQQVDQQAVIEPVMPGTVPNYVWQENLQAQIFTIPLANFDQHNHAPNENIKLTAFLQGIKIIYQLVKIYQD
ncbi:M20/M25/M40 family metallo-hydrolase, partial [Liquorilactobacillus ghanensis]